MLPFEADTFEVTSDELDALEAAFAEESRALGFCSGAFSAFATGLFGWLTAGNSLPPATFALVTAWTLAFGVLTAWFFLTYWQVRQQRPKLLQRIRERRR